jgi:hypothetical protein
MRTVDIMNNFSLSYICDAAEFYGIALMMLGALMKRYSCDGMRDVFYAQFS